MGENRRFKRKICFTYKFYNSPADYARMREVSDRLCREYAISVIENPGGRAKNYAEWQAEQNGKPTHRGTIRADIDRAILASTTERDFLQVMAGSITADMNRLFAAQEKAQSVVARSTSFASPQAAKLTRSAAPPSPTEPASLGFGGDPNRDGGAR